MAHSEYRILDTYTELRNMVLGLDAEALGLTDASEAPILAVLMETGYDKAVATLVVVADGSASLYFSNGGGMIGAGQYETVMAQTSTFILQAGQAGAQFVPVETCPLPVRGSTVFYMVTQSGVLAAAASNQELESDSHPLTPLFAQGHNVISAIRVTQEE